MKFKNLIAKSAIAYLLLLTSSAAMAADSNCASGVIANATVGNVSISDTSCLIYESTITGQTFVTRSPSIIIVDSKFGSDVLIENSDYVAVLNALVVDQNLVVRDSNDVRVIDSETIDGIIRVNRKISAWASRNKASRRLVCRNNTDLVSFLNHAGQVLNCQGRLPF